MKVKWWPPGVRRLSRDPVSGAPVEQMLMEFYNKPGMWRCGVCGWNEVFSCYSVPSCRKCGHDMKLQESIA